MTLVKLGAIKKQLKLTFTRSGIGVILGIPVVIGLVVDSCWLLCCSLVDTRLTTSDVDCEFGGGEC